MNKLLLLLVIVSFNSFGKTSQLECGKEKDCKVILEKQTEHIEFSKKLNQKIKVVTKWKTKIVYRDKPSVVKYLKPKTRIITKTKTFIHKPRKNSISVMGLYERTNVSVRENSTNYKVDRDYEPNLGLIYQRDFSEKFRFSVGGSLDGAGYLGLGLNF
jgi:hypothetical protein